MSAIDLHDFFAWFGATSISVSLLIIAVLLLRKPVARRLGPEAAYLLWLLPAARLFLPAGNGGVRNRLDRWRLRICRLATVPTAQVYSRFVGVVDGAIK